MPIYEYECGACHAHFEEMKKVSDPPVATCPKCGKESQRVISQTSFALKGGGWYKDGYAKSAPSSSAAKPAAPVAPAPPAKKPSPPKGD